jgi:UDP-N-acetylglucosamine--N-acetylmuramyl-(pentapeptide) pyrophosphoryl-undecaprenol N-acetylglucosamine transferase
MDDTQPHIVLSGGGTGGHLFPGLAVAGRLTALRPGLPITFAGSGRPFEREQVAAAGFHYLPVRCSPLPRGIGGVWRFLADNLAGYRAAGRFLQEAGARVVIGLGGYASVPMARAALAQDVPLVLLEQNAIPGRATRWLARRAAVVCTAFESCHARLPWRCQVRLTGNPVRNADFRSLQDFGSRVRLARGDRPRLLVLGGSNGSRALNETLPAALAALGWQLDGWDVLHQAGRADADATRRRYRDLGLRAEVVGFLADVPGTLVEADLAVCRSGGTTLAELAAAGVPALLVPYPHAADDHQRRNAEVFAAVGACRVLDERGGPGSLGQRMAGELGELLSDASGRRAMSRSVRRLGRPEAAATVADLVLGLLDGTESRGLLRAAA